MPFTPKHLEEQAETLATFLRDRAEDPDSTVVLASSSITLHVGFLRDLAQSLRGAAVLLDNMGAAAEKVAEPYEARPRGMTLTEPRP